uniref:Claudin n=1 Tax=Cyprinus carpio TaxID=7962 RepID=A0A8C2F170_CYPCA
MISLTLLGTTLGILGWLGIIISCALPLWRVTAFIGTNIVTAQIMWEGLWMICVVESTGQMQCQVYDSMLALPQDICLCVFFFFFNFFFFFLFFFFFFCKGHLIFFACSLCKHWVGTSATQF